MSLISSQYKCKYTQVTRYDIRDVRLFSLVAQFLALSLDIGEKGEMREIFSTGFHLYNIFSLPSPRKSTCDQNFYFPKMNRTWDFGVFWHLYTKHFSPKGKRDSILCSATGLSCKSSIDYGLEPSLLWIHTPSESGAQKSTSFVYLLTFTWY